ncbi:terminase small subunit [candidate division WOR-3 bacterium]|nr:terminase small subunit [candidate division WOR-3 bacterium]
MSIKRTLRERKFIKAYIENSGNATEAYLAINPNCDRKNAREYGYRMLQKVDISVSELMEMMGTTDAYLNQKLNEGLEAKKVVSVIPIKPKEAQPNSPDLPEANSKNIEFVDVEDYPTRHKYLDTALKLKGTYPTEKKKVDLNVSGELEVNSELDKKLAQLDIKELKKISESILKANAKKL